MDGKDEISMEVRYAVAIQMTETYSDALEKIMRHAMHNKTLDLKSAQRALAEIHEIARKCRNVEGE